MKTSLILLVSLLLRVIFLIYGIYQDKYLSVPYTDIDYFVFTDAAKYVFLGESPYSRATYRYTPLLAWMLVPVNYWFEFGKVLFVLCDLIAGYLILLILDQLNGTEKKEKTTSFISYNKLLSLIWLWNPMVITISTRGSSESLLALVVLSMLYFAICKKYTIAGLITGLAIHLKIYPFIYISAILLLIDNKSTQSNIWTKINPFTVNKFEFVLSTIFSFAVLTTAMYYIYGYEYIYEAYLYHLTRLDHRHNFSIYNLSLYFSSYALTDSDSLFQLEKIALFPQLILSTILIPLSLATSIKKLPAVLFIQTFVFVAFNKVITSQYFIWYICLLPFYLATTTISLYKGAVMITLWVLGQALWLYYGYQLEFLGTPDIFTWGIWSSSVVFFIIQVWLIGEFIADLRAQKDASDAVTKKKKKKKTQ